MSPGYSVLIEGETRAACIDCFERRRSDWREQSRHLRLFSPFGFQGAQSSRVSD